jgi:hypothetical protein
MASLIPFKRVFKKGASGNDVVAVKRGLARAGFGTLAWARTSGKRFGWLAARRLRAFPK